METEQAMQHADKILALSRAEVEADRKACPNGLIEIIDNVVGYLKRARKVGVGVRIVKLNMLRNTLAQEELI